MQCPTCGAENPTDNRFCESCGTSLAASCPSCGQPLRTGARFCGSCGYQLGGAPPAAAPPVQSAAAPVAERRVVSVLFADLVGFTPLSEARDPEEVRELLSRYFDTARTLVSRYGGVVEKFIGDAVMAVWGVPTAHGDDAERAVRAALDLVESVAALGGELGATGLAARAGVVTGEVAVTLGAAGEGMVAGDAVNTAARVQAEADAGTVLVDEVTRASSAAAIGYEDAGGHELKGKSEPVRLWRVTRVVGTVGGTERVDGLEASFLGRDREMRAVKEALHAAVEQHRARLTSVVGAAGVGKSRLRWEFFKYTDGLADTVLWHLGRCLPYGDGVAYWALAEIVRARLDIAEEEPPEQVADKLAAGLLRWVPAEADREFLLPRLGALLGIADPGLGREELFAGWRLWFEQLSEHDPVVIVLEDLQWADAGLLDFLEHLLDWSADRPLYLLTLARPELLDRRPTWGSRRNATTLTLDPLPEETMAALLDELVPGMPDRLRDDIAARADGIPLYAVEMVRSLIDRDLVQPVEGRYRVVGAVDALEVPASLASLVAARIDALPPDERSLVQGLAVLGSTFPRPAVTAVSNAAPAQLDELLADLVRKEILSVRTDRLSPDRGQYAFTQSMLRQVAYDTLSRRDRKARHLDVAAHLRSTFPDDGAEVAEVVAQHYRDALEAVPDDPDADAIRVEAVAAFTRAGHRAESVGAPEVAARAYRTAADLTVDLAEKAALMDRSGRASHVAARFDEAVESFRQAVDLYHKSERPRDAAQVAVWLGRSLNWSGRAEEGIGVLRQAVDDLSTGEVDRALVSAHAVFGGFLSFAGRPDEARPHIETGLELAQALELWEELAAAAMQKALLLDFTGRSREALTHLNWAIETAEQYGQSRVVIISNGNAAELCLACDRPGVEEYAQVAIERARRLGDPAPQAWASSTLSLLNFYRGRFDEADRLASEQLEPAQGIAASLQLLHLALVPVHAARGQVDLARADEAAVNALRASDDLQDLALRDVVVGIAAWATGDVERAHAKAAAAFRSALQALGPNHLGVRLAFPVAVDAAFASGRLTDVAELMSAMGDRPIGYISPFLRSQLARYRARLAAASGEPGAVDPQYEAAAQALRDLGYPYWLALVQLDHARWRLDQGDPDGAAALLRPAVDVLERLGAVPALADGRDLLTQAAPATLAR